MFGSWYYINIAEPVTINSYIVVYRETTRKSILLRWCCLVAGEILTARRSWGRGQRWLGIHSVESVTHGSMVSFKVSHWILFIARCCTIYCKILVFTHLHLSITSLYSSLKIPLIVYSYHSFWKQRNLQSDLGSHWFSARGSKQINPRKMLGHWDTFAVPSWRWHYFTRSILDG